MIKKLIAGAAVGGALLVSAAPAFAAPPNVVDGFVCPVFNSDAVGENNPNAVPISGGDFTILGPEVSVPDIATNQDGAGVPNGPHAAPGDEGYSAIWGVAP